jgi:hypothetical protein
MKFIKSLVVLSAFALVFSISTTASAMRDPGSAPVAALDPETVTVSVSAPSAVNAGNTIAPSTPAIVDAGNTVVPSTPAIVDASNTVVPASTPTPSQSTGGGSSTSSGGGYASGFINPISGTSCPVVTSLLKKGVSNTSEVTKLQTFLKNVEKADVEVNGKFDDKTESAVITFQNKYKDVILAPWGVTKASGVVYITTASKINNIACGRPMTLSTSDLATINSYQNSVEQNSTNNTQPTVSPVQNQNENVTPTNTVEVGVETNSDNNTAAVANTSIFGSFWKFIKGLFTSKK